MATQVLASAPVPVPKSTVPTTEVPLSFQISSQDSRLAGLPAASVKVVAPPLGVLENFTGNFAGTGFNLIFRPNSGQTKFPNPLDPSLPAPPNPPNENVLELNLTTESLSFSSSLGEIPNRGLETQTDIQLNGVPYVQAISDVTNLATGKGDALAAPIHFEPGLWMHVPATTADPILAATLTRMASIPHGTTINAQCIEPTTSFAGPPPFTGPNALPAVDITPFVIGNPSAKVKFASQTASASNTARLPQDLSAFIAAGTITQDILNNPQLVLANAIQGQNITNTIVFTVSTTPTAPLQAGGTANIDFLQGASSGPAAGPNASAIAMSATFWIETVQSTVAVPSGTPAGAPVRITLPRAQPGAPPGPTFEARPPRDVAATRKVRVSFTQIQYVQTVLLNFAGLTWPHVSCATLVPSTVLQVPAAAFA